MNIDSSGIILENNSAIRSLSNPPPQNAQIYLSTYSSGNLGWNLDLNIVSIW